MAMLARFRWLAVSTVLGSLVGFLVSYLLSPQYTARAVLEEILPSQYDIRRPVDKSASQQRLTTYLEQAFSLNVRKMIEREGIATTEEVEKVYRQIRKNTKLQDAVLGPPIAPELVVDLVYTDSAPQRAEQLCGVLTSAILEKTRVDGAGFNGLGQPPSPYGVEVVLPCGTSRTPVFPNRVLCAAIGSATGLLVGMALIEVRRKSLGQVAEPHC